MRTSSSFFSFAIFLAVLNVKFNSVTCEVVSLSSSNIDSVISENELVLVNFYADWCRFSRMLGPIFEQAEQKIKENYPGAGKVILAKVDCDKEGNIAAQHQVTKYPTLKIFRFGQVVKKEYRGQRSAEAFFEFVQDQLERPIKVATNTDTLDDLDWHRRHIIGYFDAEDTDDYMNFKKVAAILRGDCDFHSLSGEISAKERIAGNKIIYRPNVENFNEMMYSGSIRDYKVLLKWVTDKCVPLVREITFENAEELTEEGLPFLILFHHPDDTETPEKFKKQVALQLLQERSYINFLVADGLKFTHPLHHLGKSAEDLPVLAIDSFKHMYIWRNQAKLDMEKPGLLEQFIKDLKSGKLHREFHEGPDPVQVTETSLSDATTDGQPPASSEHIPHDATKISNKDLHGQTSPPESLFKKLAPSRTRYTILKDEL